MQYGGGPLGHARGSPSQFDSVDEELLAALNSHAASLVEDLDSADNKRDCCDALRDALRDALHDASVR